jgi:hypothetical protein
MTDNKSNTNDNTGNSSTSSITSIYRFKFSNELVQLIERFAIVHKDDSKEKFKEGWQKFIKDNNDIIKTEKLELTRKGYTGNLNDKMYKSARYYFRLKTATNVQLRRKYIGLDKSLINTIDDFIKQKQALNKRNNQQTFKPSDGYVEFCQRYVSILQKEMNELNKHRLNADEANIKIKKTFKNRYFQIIKTDVE